MSSHRTFNPASRIRIVLTSETPRALASKWRIIAATVAELCVGVFFITGVVQAGLGAAAPWFVLCAVLALLVVHTCDVESWALFIPGGLPGRVGRAWCRPLAMTAAAAALVERLLFVGLAALVAARYLVTPVLAVLRPGDLAPHGPSADLAELVAVVLVGLVWVQVRSGKTVASGARWHWTWLAVIVAAATVAAGLLSLVSKPPGALNQLPAVGMIAPSVGWLAQAPPLVALIAACLVGFGHALPGVGTGNGLARLAGELPQPRLPALRRTVRVVAGYGLLVAVGGSLVFNGIVPASLQPRWYAAPLVGVAWWLPAPPWVRLVLVCLVTAAAAAILCRAVGTGLAEAQGTLQQLCRGGRIERVVLWPGRRDAPGGARSVSEDGRSVNLARPGPPLIRPIVTVEF